MLNFRQVLVSDAEALNCLDKEIFQSKCYGDYLSLIQSDSTLIYLSCEDDKIVGYIYWSLTQDEAELFHLGVSEGNRRKHIGEKLMLKSLNLLALKGIAKAFLEVGAKNKPAQKLYEKVGFKQYNIRKNYYGINDDAKCYVLEVK